MRPNQPQKEASTAMNLCPEYQCESPSMDQRDATQEGRCKPCRLAATDPNRNKNGADQ